MKGLWRAVRARSHEAWCIVAVQAALFGICIAAGQWWVYPVLWVAPWMTLWKLSNRLRAIAEHAGMTRSHDRRLTTHVVRQSRIARLMFVPYNTGWHLAHHVDMGVPWPNLPKLHAELVARRLGHRGAHLSDVPALWHKLASGVPRSVAAPAA